MNLNLADCVQKISPVFFTKSKLPLQTWLQLIRHWSMDMPVIEATKQVKISEKRIDIYQYIRKGCLL